MLFAVIGIRAAVKNHPTYKGIIVAAVLGSIAMTGIWCVKNHPVVNSGTADRGKQSGGLES